MAEEAPTGEEIEENDVANEEEEENFEAGMRRNAQDMEAHDVDQDNKLDFGEFCNLVREREVGDFTEEECVRALSRSTLMVAARST